MTYVSVYKAGICPITGKRQEIEITYREHWSLGELHPTYYKGAFSCSSAPDVPGEICNTCPIYQKEPYERLKL